MLGQSNTNTIATYIKIENEDITVTQNGVYEAGEEYTGLGTVTVQVDSAHNQEKSIAPTTSEQIVTPDQGYTGLSSVTVGAVTNAIDNNIQASNIKSGVNILGITGNVVELSATPTTVTPTTSEQTITPQGAYNGFSTITVDPVTSSIDPNITSSNIVNGVTILGVQGTATALNGETITVTPTTSQQVITPTSPHNGITEVTVDGVTSSIDSNIAAGNIKSGVSILGVNGTVTELNGTTLNVTPTASSQSHTPSAPNNAYTQVTVDGDANLVAGNIVKDVTIFGVTGSYEGQVINNQNKTVTATTSEQNVTADSGYTGLGTVTLNAVDNTIDNNIVAGNIKSGVSILGVTGNLEAKEKWYNWRTEEQIVSNSYPLPSGVTFDIGVIGYGNGKFVTKVNSSNNVIYYSNDGETWTASTAPNTKGWTSVAYGAGKFVAVSSDNTNKAVYSTDGITWNESTLPTSGQWYGITYGNGKFVAIADSSRNAAYSTDGVNWTACIDFPYGLWKSIACSDTLFVAIGTNNSLAHSTDGITWIEDTMPSSMQNILWSSIIYADGKFVAISRNSSMAKAAYSMDGINWEVVNLPTSGYFDYLCYGDGKFVAFDTQGKQKLCYSTDGVNWYINNSIVTVVERLTYGNGKFVAFDSYNTYKSILFNFEQDLCYTLTDEPIVSTQVYEIPKKQSVFVISSVNTDDIILSDTKTYYRYITGDILGPVLGTKTIVSNDTYSAASDYLDGYSSVTVAIPSDINNQNKTADTDGIYSADLGYSGLGQVTVTAGAVISAEIEAQLHEINSGTSGDESGDESGYEDPPL